MLWAVPLQQALCLAQALQAQGAPLPPTRVLLLLPLLLLAACLLQAP